MSLRMRRAGLPAAGALGASLVLAALVALVNFSAQTQRTELDWLEGYEWEPPYPGAGPVTPEWEVTPASVGQTALTAFDPSHAESNVLGNDYKYPDYARRPRTGLPARRPRCRYSSGAYALGWFSAKVFTARWRLSRRFHRHPDGRLSCVRNRVGQRRTFP